MIVQLVVDPESRNPKSSYSKFHLFANLNQASKERRAQEAEARKAAAAEDEQEEASESWI